MARNAVHAALARNTEMLIGRGHGRVVPVPERLVGTERIAYRDATGKFAEPGRWA